MVSLYDFVMAHGFLDRVKIYVKAGDGGAGAVSFRREKYVPRGGPDGGSGGRGGAVVLEASGRLHTLTEFRYRKHFRADSGGRGEGNNRHGKNGRDLVLKVPPGTAVHDAISNDLLADLVQEGERFVMAQGGRGGRGNATFKGPTRQAPRMAELGAPGESRWLLLELKLTADVGIVGMPNAGKSTLLAAVTAARPKIADYPFTTLVPNLGVVETDSGASFVLADIPGLIEGAHQGAGLGQEFLRHVERTRVLLHVLDASAGPAEELLRRYAQVQTELKAYRPELARRAQLVVLNKMDAVTDRESIDRFQQAMLGRRRRVYLISAATRAGCDELLDATWEALQAERRRGAGRPAPPALKVYHGPPAGPPFEIVREGETFVVRGATVERLVAMTDLRNPEALHRLQRRLENWGLSQALAARGARGGETVRIRDVEFLYDATR